ncbi:MAG TPA: long-chain-fatty-acid--CoA ligase [Woeseiaceae bacterium]
MLAGRSGYWPRHLPRTLVWPETTISRMLERSAESYPRRPAVHFFGTDLGYAEFLRAIEHFAGWLTRRAGVRRGDRVLLYLQNSPQWLIAYFGTLRADAVAVPISPMSRARELAHYLSDSGARVLVCAQDLVEQVSGADAASLEHVIVATYSDYLRAPHDYALPSWLTEPARRHGDTIAWTTVLAAGEAPPESRARPDDVCLLPYTSGSTGKPKACMHTHRTFMHNVAGGALWHWMAPGTACLALPPMCHVAGLLHSVHLPLFVGGTAVVMPRWNRELALQLLERQRVAHACVLPTAVIDLLADDKLKQYDLSSLRRLTAGGAAMPTAVWEKVREVLGLAFVEGYGMTETAATSHINPIERPKPQCLGVPFFDTASIVVDPVSLEPLGPHEPGEILVSGPQLFQGYWNQPEETARAFIEVEGRRYLRTGDIGYVDEEGYFFMTDRAKRMINASGHNVWPAEVESVLYQHPGVKEACVIGAPDAYRGETVKALIVRDQAGDGALTAEALIEWARARMAAYKYPRIVEFVEQLPKSPVGKILWRELQDAERARAASAGNAASEVKSETRSRNQ